MRIRHYQHNALPKTTHTQSGKETYKKELNKGQIRATNQNQQASKSKTQIEKSPDKANMDTKAAMHSRTINTEEDPICNRSPSRILGIAIKAHLKK